MKVSFVHKLIYDYRLSFYESLGREPDIDLTVLHSGESMRQETSSFKEVILAEKKFGGFFWQQEIGRYLEGQDVVVYLFDIRYISSIQRIVRRLDDSRVLFWGIGLGESKISRLIGNRFRVFMTRYADRVAVYMPGNKDFLIESGAQGEKIFVSPNTVEVKNPFLPELSDRSRIVFLGSLKPRKRLEDLLIAFSRVSQKLPEEIGIDVIGGGDINRYQELATSLGIKDRVKFIGHLTDETVIGRIFSKAIVCVSPGQIGLTVLHSFAFGTPFVTSFDAITGGEKENLKHGKTGLFYDGSIGQLADLIESLVTNPEYAHGMGAAAYQYYQDSMTLDKLTNSFLKQFRGN